jgi:thiamine biosynthesis lipoprotein
MLRHGFRAMGSEIELLLDAPATTDAAAVFSAAQAEFARLEGLLSRFLPDSELSRLNRDGAIDAGPDLAAVVRLALDARTRTGGRFDPTVHDAMLGAGYDRTFAQMPGELGRPIEPARCAGGVHVDAAGRIELEPGVRLDLGGIGKSYAAESSCALVARLGPALVDAGGDIATRGGAWPVGVATADGSLTLLVENGGLATSGIDRRSWLADGEEAHHLIDPASGRPAAGDLIRVTVVARDAVAAEIHAKALFLVGAARAAAEANANSLPCVLVTRDGQTVLAGGISA